MIRSLFTSILLSVAAVSFAQKVQKVTATYTYYAPENVTLEEAKHTALDRAKISAIADAFGTLVSQSNSTVITNQNGESDNRFYSLGGSEVKGEWIETIKEPVYNIRYEGGMLVVSVEVTGRIREIVSAGIDFTAKILRNGTEEKFESSEFRSGDDMFLYFKSPVDGYLAVYLHDETTQEVYCLLPYKDSGEGAYRIEHDHPYIFFSVKHAPDRAIIDEYKLICNREAEYNDIYVIFSQNIFAKTQTKETVDTQPRRTTFEDFQKWLTMTKGVDSSMAHKRISLQIHQ